MRTLLMTIGGALLVAAPTYAGFSSTMFQSTDPSSWVGANQIASLDSSNFDYVDSSGFEAVFGSFVLDRTSVRTDVYRVDSPRTVTTGASSITLDVGDLVFAYRIRLVSSFPGLTVGSVQELQVIGAPDFGFGSDPMAASLINGQGFVLNTTPRTPNVGNIDDADVFGSSVDWEWPSLDTDQLDNSDTITLLLFTDPASIGSGVLNLIAPPGQSGGISGTAQASEAPSVLIPIVPAPGAVLLGLSGVGFIFGSRRRA